MNILFIASWYPTETNKNLGVFIKEHAHSVEISGDNVLVLALVVHRSKNFFKVQVSDKVDENGIRTVLIEIFSRFHDLVYHFVPLQIYYIHKVFRRSIKNEFKPDLIHSNVIFPAGVIGHSLSRKLNIKHIITEHWSRVKVFSQMPVLSYFGKKAYTNATKILPVSEFLKQEICDAFSIVDADKFRVIGNVIDSKVFCYKKKEPNATELRLCSIASWMLNYPVKQPELLINAIAELQKNFHKKIKLTMIGGGDKVPELIRLCNSLGVNADFTGYLPKPEVAQKLYESDYFVHPTSIETFGVVVAEALLTGTPVICSDISALSEIVNTSNGVLCENKVSDWVKAIAKIENMPFDREKIASDIQHKFSPEHIGKSIHSVYQEV